MLECLSTYLELLVLVGDVNIRLELVGDPNVVGFYNLLESYGLTLYVQSVTHDVYCSSTSCALAVTCSHRPLTY